MKKNYHFLNKIFYLAIFNKNIILKKFFFILSNIKINFLKLKLKTCNYIPLLKFF